MIPIKGKTWRIVSMSPYETETVDTDMFLIGIFDEDGTLSDYARSGRPGSYRVFQTINECRNGILGLKCKYNGNLRPVRLLTGEVVEEER